jgi:PAS domain S-box-containing protein
MSKSPLGSGVRQSPGRARANSPSQAGVDVSGPTHDGWRREALEAVVDSCDDAIATLTLEGTVMTWNPAAAEIFSLSSEEALGRDISKLMVPAELQPQLWRWLAEIAAGTEVRHEIRRRRRDGTDLVVSIRGLPLRDGGGRVIGSAWIGRDAGGHGPRDGDEDRGVDSQLWRQRIDQALGDDRLVSRPNRSSTSAAARSTTTS